MVLSIVDDLRFFFKNLFSNQIKSKYFLTNRTFFRSFEAVVWRNIFNVVYKRCVRQDRFIFINPVHSVFECYFCGTVFVFLSENRPWKTIMSKGLWKIWHCNAIWIYILFYRSLRTSQNRFHCTVVRINHKARMYFLWLCIWMFKFSVKRPKTL